MLASIISTGNAVALNEKPQPQAGEKVAIVYSTGGLGDLSFNDAAKRGVEAAKAANSGLNVTEACQSSCEIPDITDALANFADEGGYDLIIGIGFSAADGVTAAAQAHPNTKFMIIDSFVNETNVASIEFKEQEGSFLVGAMAAMTTQTNKLGFLGGLDIPLINRFAAGFEHGAKTINSKIKVTVTYAPDPNNPWGDVSGGQQVGSTMISDGIDVIFAAAGGTGTGVFTAVENANKAGGTTYAIGVDSDQDYLSPGNVLCSMVKKVDNAVQGNIQDLIDGTWAAGDHKLGLKENGVDISPMLNTTAEANAIYSGTQTRMQKVQELKQSIVSGDIVVAETLDEVSSLYSTSSGGLPVSFAPIFIAFAGLAVITMKIRKQKL